MGCDASTREISSSSPYKLLLCEPSAIAAFNNATLELYVAMPQHPTNKSASLICQELFGSRC